DIEANIRFSPTLKTGWPHGSSSYVSGSESATSRIRRCRSSSIARLFPFGQGRRRGRLRFALTRSAYNESPPEPGFARREAHQPRGISIGDAAGGSAAKRTVRDARKEGAGGGTRGSPTVRDAWPPARSSGVLLHPTSLPGGRLGPEAEALVDWLVDAGQSWWQVLPLGPPDPFGSPSTSPSAFAGSPALLAEPAAPVSERGLADF